MSASQRPWNGRQSDDAGRCHRQGARFDRPVQGPATFTSSAKGVRFENVKNVLELRPLLQRAAG